MLWIVCFAMFFGGLAHADPFDIDLSATDAKTNVIQNPNPDISFVADFLAGNHAALYQVGDAIHRPVYLREIEIDGVGYVSPYAKGTFVVSFGEDGDMDVEEANTDIFELPASFDLKLGKMLVDTETLNPLHQHAIPFVDRPLVLQHLFGEEGLKTVGANLSWIVPNPWDHYVLLSGTYGVNNNDDANTTALYGGDKKSMVTNLHLMSSWDLNDKTYLNVNASGVFAPLSDGSLTRIYLADFLVRYAPNPYSNALTFLNGVSFSHENPFQSGAFDSYGFYDYLGWQFSPRWRAGVRYDQTHDPAANTNYPGDEREYSAILSFYPTETNYLRVQYARHELPGSNTWENKIWLQLDFTVGPHQPHMAL